MSKEQKAGVPGFILMGVNNKVVIPVEGWWEISAFLDNLKDDDEIDNWLVGFDEVEDGEMVRRKAPMREFLMRLVDEETLKMVAGAKLLTDEGREQWKTMMKQTEDLLRQSK